MFDKADDPARMIDQYLKAINKDLGKVKAEAEAVRAEEQRLQREINECQEEIKKLERYSNKALEAGSEGEARNFLEKKAVWASKLSELQASYQLASAKSEHMKQMLDKLLADISELESIKREGFEN
ncbi:PspA/IM30 family protein [Neobacillus mesonae]|uniref:PspA/IM30 family protein n=1 Tax=Neobacillus mesonae TaxID=1193713 RepID=UPI00083580B7|nr:PspA/IM30 family protein [Neobacillus mesonae]